jgi:hypothetical protein
MSEKYKSAKVHLGIHCYGDDGNLMYVLIDDKSAFDLINLPEGGNAAVRHKAIDNGKQHIIFQHWFPVFWKIDEAFRIEAYQFKKFAAASSQQPGASS